MNKFSPSGARRLSQQVTAQQISDMQGGDLSSMLYGMPEKEYEIYLLDCQESERMCKDAHAYLLNTPDVLANFF